VPKILGAKNPL